MERALASDDSWPETQFLWEIHPFAVWLGDLMNQLFNRREVPVLLLDDRLAEGESIFLFFGRIPNQAGSTLLDSWIGVHYRNSEFTGCLDIDEVLNLTGLRPDALVKPGEFPSWASAEPGRTGGHAGRRNDSDSRCRSFRTGSIRVNLRNRIVWMSLASDT